MWHIYRNARQVFDMKRGENHACGKFVHGGRACGLVGWIWWAALAVQV